jgi:hypothetical protein
MDLCISSIYRNTAVSCDPEPVRQRSSNSCHGTLLPVQLRDFVFCPFTLTSTSSRQGDGGLQGIVPSVAALTSRSTWNQSENCVPILVTVRLYRDLQLDVFVFRPFTRPSIRSADAGIQGIMPSALTLTSRSTWD